MVLYTSIVVLATLIAVPEDVNTREFSGLGHDHFLLALIWGETVGLALAHWFAFNVAAAGFRAGQPLREDIVEGFVELAGAGSVALLTTIVVVATGDQDDIVVAGFTTAAIVATAGFETARRAGRSRFWSVVIGLLILVLALVVAGIKASLGAH